MQKKLKIYKIILKYRQNFQITYKSTKIIIKHINI